MQNFKEEKTFMMIKPDGVDKCLTGEIIKRVEQRGLRMIAMEMFTANAEEIDNHYPKDDIWIARLGDKSLSTYTKYNVDPIKEFGTSNNLEIGNMVRKWLVDYMVSGPSVKMIVQGSHAVDMVRKITGNTLPYIAEVGTIRGDFSNDSPVIANLEKRAVMNLVHASETSEEAKHEIEFWFGK